MVGTVNILFIAFTLILCWKWEGHGPRARIFKCFSSRGFQSPEEPLLLALICSFVMMGRRLVNFNFWFQKLSNTAQMRNQLSQLPWLCGGKIPCHWWRARHMTSQGLVQQAHVATTSITGCLLSFTSITSHSQTQLIFNSWKPAQE